MAELELRNLSKSFKDVLAVDGLSIGVAQGELVCLLGPSGCGKTTTLRLIAGFETPTVGEIWLHGHDITGTPTHKRNIGVVFQSYALFPHLTVRENIGFGLKMRGRPRQEIDAAVEKALQLVRLPGLGHRFPKELSGGQQQRVALARAVAIEPALLLLDEPLSNLDAKLREEMRVEIREIQQRLGITTIFVTHDQEEALTLSDRMVVMDAGHVVQSGTPIELYERPAHPFVAEFIGQANLIRGQVVGSQNGATLFRSDSGLELLGEPSGLPAGTPALAVLKHERIRLDGAGLPATIEFRTYLGGQIQYVCSAGAERLGVRVLNQGAGQMHEPGASVQLAWDPADCKLIPIS